MKKKCWTRTPKRTRRIDSLQSTAPPKKKNHKYLGKKKEAPIEPVFQKKKGVDCYLKGAHSKVSTTS